MRKTRNKKLAQLTTAEHGGLQPLNRHIWCLALKKRMLRCNVSRSSICPRPWVIGNTENWEGWGSSRNFPEFKRRFDEDIYAHADGALRAYPKTITNSFAEEPIFAYTFSDDDIFCNHNSISLCSCNVGTTGSPLHLISTSSSPGRSSFFIRYFCKEETDMLPSLQNFR